MWKKSSGLRLSLLYTTRNSYRLYPRLLHSSRKSSESDTLGSAALAEEGEEPSYTASDSFKSFRKGAYSTGKPGTRWSVPPSNAYGSTDSGMINGPPSRRSSGGTSDTGGPTPASAPIARYGMSQQNSYAPPSRSGNAGRATAKGDLDSKFGSRSSWRSRPAPKPAAAEGSARDTQPPPSGPTRPWDSSGTGPGVLGHRSPSTSSGPPAPKLRRNDSPPQFPFRAKEEYQQTEQARDIPPIRTPWSGRHTDDRRPEAPNGFSSGKAQSSSPGLGKQGSINYMREFDQVGPESKTAAGKGNHSQLPSKKTTYSGLGQSIVADQESPIYSTDTPKTPDDIRTFEGHSQQVSGDTDYLQATQKMNLIIDELSATYVPIEDKLSSLAGTRKGSAEQRNAQKEEAKITEGLRTRPLTSAELEYERRQSAKARERSHRRGFGTGESAILEEDEGPLTGKAAKKAKKAKKREKRVEAAPAMVPLYLPEYISVANLARAVKMRLDDFIVQMQNMGFEDVSYDHVMNAEVAGLIAMEYGYEPIADTSKEEDLFPRYVLIFHFSERI